MTFQSMMKSGKLPCNGILYSHFHIEYMLKDYRLEHMHHMMVTATEVFGSNTFDYLGKIHLCLPVNAHFEEDVIVYNDTRIA